MNGWNDGSGGDDDFIDESNDNIGNRADGPPTHDGPRPPRFEGEGQRRSRLGLNRNGPRRERGPRFGGGQPRGDAQPGNGNGFPPRGEGRRERGPRHGGGQQHGNGQPQGYGQPQGNAQPQGNGQPMGAGAGQPQGGDFQRGPRPPRDRGPRHQRHRGDDAQGPRPAEAEVGDRRPRGGLREDETKVYGVNACLAVFQHRPDAIIRAYVNNETLRRFGYTMKFLAEQRRAYHVVNDDELARVTESEHHGGVCFVIRKRAPLLVPEFLQLFGDAPVARVLLLEGVGNPHNLGAVLRSCAHFGVDAVLVDDAGYVQGGAAARVAEGAAETVRLVQFRGVGRTLEALKSAGFTRIVTSSHAAGSLYEAQLPAKLVFVFGAEGTGISPQASENSDLGLAIPGTGNVESLNVSVAAAVVLAELFRRGGPGGMVTPTPSTRVWEMPPEQAEAAPTAALIGDDEPTVLGEHTPPFE